MTHQSSSATPLEIINDLNRRMLAGEEVTKEEIIAGIQALRDNRAERTATKQKKVAATQKQAELGEDILNNLI